MKTTFAFLNFLVLIICTRSLETETSTELLDLHNSERREIGVADLSWSDTLSKSAQSWADHLAATNTFYHSGESGVGENIAEASFRRNVVVALFNAWSDEKKYFIPTLPYPNCTTGGVDGHYTQIIWSKTTEVGCGIANTSSASILVCQYQPPGNYIGNYVYTNADIVQNSSSNSSGSSSSSGLSGSSNSSNSSSTSGSSNSSDSASSGCSKYPSSSNNDDSGTLINSTNSTNNSSNSTNSTNNSSSSDHTGGDLGNNGTTTSTNSTENNNNNNSTMFVSTTTITTTTTITSTSTTTTPSLTNTTIPSVTTTVTTTTTTMIST